MEPTITLTLPEALMIVGAIGTLIGFLTGQLTRRNVSQRLIDHLDDCGRYRESMNKILDEFKGNVNNQFSEVRRGIEGLYQQKRGWFR